MNQPSLTMFQQKTDPDVNMNPTKRNVLSSIATLFDPLQFLSPSHCESKGYNAGDMNRRCRIGQCSTNYLIAKWRKWDLRASRIVKCHHSSLSSPTKSIPNSFTRLFRCIKRSLRQWPISSVDIQTRQHLFLANCRIEE